MNIPEIRVEDVDSAATTSSQNNPGDGQLHQQQRSSSISNLILTSNTNKNKTDHKPIRRQVSAEIVRTYRNEFNEERELHEYQHQQQAQHSKFRVMNIPFINHNNDYSHLPNRPPESRWKQQKLPAWQPILRPWNVIITFYLFGVLCIVLGAFMFYSNSLVKEIIIDYTDCNSTFQNHEPCYNRWEYQWERCGCDLTFHLDEKITGPVFIYYSLEGFFQNHRRYVSSVDHYQLLGKNRLLNDIRQNCYPYSDIDGKIIAPCGAIANSMFMDQFKLFKVDNDKEDEIKINEQEISWPFERNTLYKNPAEGFRSFAKPINWSIRINELGKGDNMGYQNEHFMVWMRVAAFPTFRKLWGRIEPNISGEDKNVLPKGKYVLKVDYEFQTVFDKFRIPKKVIISNMSWMGGKNSFLSILYMVTGCLCLIMATSTLLYFCLVLKRQNKSHPPSSLYQSTDRSTRFNHRHQGYRTNQPETYNLYQNNNNPIDESTHL